MSFQPNRALSPDDSGRVICMAKALPPAQNLADEPGLMLALHRLRFPAADIALLAPYVAAKARELRAALGLDDPREAVAGLFFFLAMASATFFFCFVVPEEAEARECLLSAASIDCPAPHEKFGPYSWLIATQIISLIAYSVWLLVSAARDLLAWRRDMREPLAPLAERPKIAPSIDEPQQFWTLDQWAAFDDRIAELQRHAWHVYIAMAMSGDLATPPRRLSHSMLADAFVFADSLDDAPEAVALHIAEGPETALAEKTTFMADGDEWIIPHRALFEAA